MKGNTNSPHTKHDQTDQTMHTCSLTKELYIWKKYSTDSEKHTYIQYSRWVEGVRGSSSATLAYPIIWDESINSVQQQQFSSPSGSQPAIRHEHLFPSQCQVTTTLCKHIGTALMANNGCDTQSVFFDLFRSLKQNGSMLILVRNISQP